MSDALVIEAVRKTITVDCVVEEAFRVFTTDAISWWPIDSHSIHGAIVLEAVAGRVILAVTTSSAWVSAGIGRVTVTGVPPSFTLTVAPTGSLGVNTFGLEVSNINTTGPGTNTVLNLNPVNDTTVGPLSGFINTPTSGTNTATILPNDALFSRRYGRVILLRGYVLTHPELFATIRARDTSRFKQFRSGIRQLDEEGVVQVLRDPELGDTAPVLAAVGPMQFEVATHRMEHEFGAPTELSTTT